MKRLAAVVCFWVWTAQAVAESAPPPKIFEEIGQILQELGNITGLKPPRNVRSDTISKAGLRSFLEKRIQEAIEPDEIRAEEMAMKKLGFAPPDFDLKKATIELLTEQAAAFWDYKKKRLFLLDTNSAMNERTVLVHELAHALADSHFHLERYIQKGKNDDSALARQAVMEGQATWLMSESVASKMGQSLLRSPQLLDLMDRASGASGGMFPVFDEAPMYLRESLLFPYTRGVRFQQAVLEKKGKDGFGEVFRHPPDTTQQVLHPDKYFARVQPATTPLPKWTGGKGWKDLVEGTVGEFDHSVLLKQYAGEAESTEVAPKWRGGAYKVIEARNGAGMALLYVSEWQDEETAQRFFELYRRVLAGKWKRFEIKEEGAGLLRGVGDDGRFETRREGSRVTSVEGLPGEDAPGN